MFSSNEIILKKIEKSISIPRNTRIFCSWHLNDVIILVLMDLRLVI
jgi:hypothetical protein